MKLDNKVDALEKRLGVTVTYWDRRAIFREEDEEVVAVEWEKPDYHEVDDLPPMNDSEIRPPTA